MASLGQASCGEAVAAHVALAYDAEVFVVLRGVVGTHQRAVLTTEALIIEMLDDARLGVLFVGSRGTPVHACWFDAARTKGLPA